MSLIFRYAVRLPLQPALVLRSKDAKIPADSYQCSGFEEIVFMNANEVSGFPNVAGKHTGRPACQLPTVR